MFSGDGSSLTWVVDDQIYADQRDISNRFLAEFVQGREEVRFPALDPYGRQSRLETSQIRLINFIPPQYYRENDFLFVAQVIGGTAHVAKQISGTLGYLTPVLLRWDGQKIELANNTAVEAVGVPRTATGYVYAKSVVRGEHEIREVHGSDDRLRLAVGGGGVRDITVSDDFASIAFRVTYPFDIADTVWLHRRGEIAARDLDIAGRVTKLDP